METGKKREYYWQGFTPEKLKNTVLFFDPDIGFEGKATRGPEHIRHDELKDFLGKLPSNSVICVYQNKQHEKWEKTFSLLRERIDYASTVVAVMMKFFRLKI